MGEIKKESLDKLLILIDEICSKDENLWFKNKISSKYGVYCIDENSQNLQLSNIENYLKLDGYKIIDYSGIKNEVVRNQLFRDCIEMSKYRLGKINDTISFDEFCRFYVFDQTRKALCLRWSDELLVEHVSDFHFGRVIAHRCPLRFLGL